MRQPAPPRHGVRLVLARGVRRQHDRLAQHRGEQRNRDILLRKAVHVDQIVVPARGEHLPDQSKRGGGLREPAADVNQHPAYGHTVDGFDRRERASDRGREHPETDTPTQRRRHRAALNGRGTDLRIVRARDEQHPRRDRLRGLMNR